jgi:hypothetical protein
MSQSAMGRHRRPYSSTSAQFHGAHVPFNLQGCATLSQLLLGRGVTFRNGRRHAEASLPAILGMLILIRPGSGAFAGRVETATESDR